MKPAVLAIIICALAATYMAAHLVVWIADLPLAYVPVLWLVLLAVMALVNAVVAWRTP